MLKTFKKTVPTALFILNNAKQRLLAKVLPTENVGSTLQRKFTFTTVEFKCFTRRVTQN